MPVPPARDGLGQTHAPIPPPAPAAAERRFGFAQKLLFLMWVVALCEPHRWLESEGVALAGKLPFPLFGLLALLTIANPPKLRRWTFYAPLTVFIGFVVVTMPFAVNPAYAMVAVKILALRFILALATLNLVRTPREAFPYLALFCTGWLFFFQLNGLIPGLVKWHPDLGNFDSFGPLMVIGIPLAYYFGMAVHDPRWRRFAFLVAALCAGGVVSSFARGAVLAAGLVGLTIWIRSPAKGRTSAAMAIGLVVVLVAGSLLDDANRGGDADSKVGFWNEMATIFTGEGDAGSDRKVLWAAATEVFKKYPVIGAGANNFGPAAAAMFRPGEVGGGYADNPETLYDRALHSSYYQVLSEHGIIGVLITLMLLFDFWRRNRALRSARLTHAWSVAGDPRYDLRLVSLGLEAAMVGFLGSAVFYNQLSVPWLYSILIINVLLHTLALQAARHPMVRAARAARRSTPAATPFPAKTQFARP